MSLKACKSTSTASNVVSLRPRAPHLQGSGCSATTRELPSSQHMLLPSAQRQLSPVDINHTNTLHDAPSDTRARRIFVCIPCSPQLPLVTHPSLAESAARRLEWHSNAAVICFKEGRRRPVNYLCFQLACLCSYLLDGPAMSWNRYQQHHSPPARVVGICNSSPPSVLRLNSIRFAAHRITFDATDARARPRSSCTPGDPSVPPTTPRSCPRRHDLPLSLFHPSSGRI